VSQTHRQIVAESWDFLAVVDPAKSAGQTSRVLPNSQTPHGNVMLSCDSLGTRHVLVPIASHDIVEPDTSSRGVQLGRSSFNDDGVRRHFVDICCPDARLFRLFDQVASSMLEALESTAGRSAPQVCAEVLASWRTMLRRASGPLGISVLRGLFGELWYLAELARQSPVAVDYWTGPDDQPQDFISARGAVEIKTTTRSPARRVTISSLDQLDEDGHGFLTLVVLSVLEDPQGTSIPELLELIVGLGVDQTRLLDRVARAGLQESDFPEASKLRLRVGNHIGYDVRAQFPRLTTRSFSPPLASGILSLRYDVDLGVAHEFRLAADELLGRGRILLGIDRT
jgi:hypothetical protein